MKMNNATQWFASRLLSFTLLGLATINLLAPPRAAANPVYRTTVRAQPPAEPPAPAVTAPVEKKLAEARANRKAFRQEQALKDGEEALKLARQSGDVPGEANSLASLALTYTATGQTAQAITSWKEAAAIQERVGDVPGRVLALGGAGALLLASEPKEAKSLLKQALALGKAETKRPLSAAESLYDAGIYCLDVGNPVEALPFLQESLAIRERLSPDSLLVASSLTGLGIAASDQDDFKTARIHFERALQLREKLAPDSPEFRHSLSNLAQLEMKAGNPKVAEDYYRRVVTLLEKQDPQSTDMVDALLQRGMTIAQGGGDVKQTEEDFKRATALSDQIAPVSSASALSHYYFGLMRYAQGDLDEAKKRFKHTLTLSEKLGPEARQTKIFALHYLGDVAARQGKFKEAEGYYRSVLKVLAASYPTPGVTIWTAFTLHDLGDVFMEQDKDREAGESFKQAMTLYSKLATSPEAVHNLQTLGFLALKQKDQLTAMDYFKRAKVLEEQLKPAPQR